MVGQQLKSVDSTSQWTPKYLDIIAVTFVTALLVSNLAAQKLFKLGPAIFSGGILVFPMSYIFGDVLTEVYGYARTRRVIYAGLFANLFMAFMLWVTIQLPPAPGYHLQDAYAAVYSLVPRVVIASVLAYLAGEFSNSFVMSKMKILTSGKFLWMRTISSTVAGQFVDTLLFIGIAFLGVFPLRLLAATFISAWLFKVLYEAIVTPLTYIIVDKLKRLEGVEHFDKKDSYNPFRLRI